MSSILYAQTAGSQTTQAGAWTPMPGLKFTLPIASAGAKTALIILNIPNPYAKGNDYPGGMFGISVNSAVLVPIAVFTSDSKIPESTGRRPTTLVVQVKLTTNKQKIEGVWQSVRSSDVIIDTPATMSAIIS